MNLAINILIISILGGCDSIFENEINDTLQDLLHLYQEHPPAFADDDFLKFLNVSRIGRLRSAVSNTPDKVFNGILDLLVSFNWLSPATMPIVKSAAEPYVKDEKFRSELVKGIELLEKSLSKEDTAIFEEALDEIEKAEFNMIKIHEVISNRISHFRPLLYKIANKLGSVETVFQRLSSTIVKVYEIVQSLMEDTMKLTFINGLLMSKEFPPIMKHNQIQSIGQVLQKAVALFTTYTAEEMPIESFMTDIAKEFEADYFTFDAFKTKLNNEQKEKVITEMLNSLLGEPLDDIGIIYEYFVDKQSQCQLQSLCLFNAKYNSQKSESKDGDEQQNRQPKKVLTRLARLLSAAMLKSFESFGILDEKMKQKAEKAIDFGQENSQDRCRKKYATSNDASIKCDLSSPRWTLDNYEHTEL